MAEPQIQLNRMGKVDQDNRLVHSSSVSAPTDACQPTPFKPKPLKWWAQLLLYTFLVIAGESASMLLNRLYFDKGGKSKWMSTLSQLVGFPAFLPFYYLLPTGRTQIDSDDKDKPCVLKLGAVYTLLGLLTACTCMLYSTGLLHLPVSTYSLICASQLAFNALFAFFLNAQKFTPYIVNSLVVLTISSTLLVFEHPSSTISGISKKEYIIGFVCTMAASAMYGLILPLTQLAFQKVIKRYDMRVILDMLVYQNLVATCAAVVGLFASGEWKTLKDEMEEFKLGKVSYVMTLIWIALTWQISAIGTLKLITQVSSLFSNVISSLGMPVVPVLAIFVFDEKMGGIKAMAMVLAVWGFMSYAFQCYLDNNKSQAQEERTIV